MSKQSVDTALGLDQESAIGSGDLESIFGIDLAVICLPLASPGFRTRWIPTFDIDADKPWKTHGWAQRPPWSRQVPGIVKVTRFWDTWLWMVDEGIGMSQAELLGFLVSVLGDLGISHMLVGSHASSFYGEARSTHDVDLVIDLDSAKIPALVARFDPDRYYISATALREGRMANLIDTFSGDKVDCFILGPDPIDRLSFSRRRNETIMGIKVALASAEDTILAKLRWSELSGGSDQQQHDVREILRHQGESLDVAYLRTQAKQMGILSRLNEFLDATREA